MSKYIRQRKNPVAADLAAFVKTIPDGVGFDINDVAKALNCSLSSVKTCAKTENLLVFQSSVDETHLEALIVNPRTAKKI